MQLRVEVKMLAVLGVVLLAAGASEGLDKCQLRKDLDKFLPANVLKHIKDLAKIVCRVEGMTGFNTSIITNFTKHWKENENVREKRQIRPARKQSSEESSEESSKELPKRPKPFFPSTTARPTTVSQGTIAQGTVAQGTVSQGTVSQGNVLQSNVSSSQDLNANISSTTSPGPRRVRSVKNHESGEVHSGHHIINGTAAPHHNYTSSASPGHGGHRNHGGRHRRFAHQSSKESGEDVHRFNNSNLTSSTGPQNNDSSSERGRRGRHERSLHEFHIDAKWSNEEPKGKHRDKPDEEHDDEPSEDSNDESDNESSEEHDDEPSEDSDDESDAESSEEHDEQDGDYSESVTFTPASSPLSGNTPSPSPFPPYRPNSFPNSYPPYGNNSLQTTSPHYGNNSFPIGGSGGRHARSTHEDEEVLWTLYGLFQLPGEIACISGSGPSLNLCNMSCENLLNQDISDDIVCLGTILSKSMTGGKNPEDIIEKIYSYLPKKQCTNIRDSLYFSGC
ncbi:dentin sialophosphoprotein-like [Hoplias malabaricus]|uniref:dentin sialophosphoprotein-like n=1 Tax=Hoplias malabaricus TaxID=27720 RepID=UPI00346213FD